MKNVKMTRKDNILTITVDLTENFGPSKSGKTTVVASSEGNQRVPEETSMFIGVNVYKK